MKPRVAFFAVRSSGHGPGGLQTHLNALMKLFADFEWEGLLFSSPLPEGSSYRPPFPVEPIPNPKPGDYTWTFWNNLERRFLEIHDAAPFDLAISESISGYPVAMLPRSRRPPFLYWGHNVGPEQYFNEWQQIDGLLSALRFPLIKVPERLWLNRIEKKTTRASDLVVASTELALERWQKWFGVLPENCFHFPNWMPFEKAPPPKKNDPSRPIRILMAGVVNRQKGFHVGLDALARCAARGLSFEASVVGNGPYLETLKAFADRLGLDGQVRWRGSLPHAELLEAFSSNDVFLMPTLRIEGQPMVLIEALAQGLPIIASDRGGNSETLGPAGIIVSPGQVAPLEKALLALLEDRKRLEALSNESRNRFDSIFSMPRARENFSQLIQAVRFNQRPENDTPD